MEAFEERREKQLGRPRRFQAFQTRHPVRPRSEAARGRRDLDQRYPIDELMASDEYPQWTYDSMPPSLRVLHHWGATPYRVLNDADGQVLDYREDALTNPEHQAAFKAEYG